MLDWMVNLIQYKIEYNCWFNANFAIYYRRLVSRRFFLLVYEDACDEGGEIGSQSGQLRYHRHALRWFHRWRQSTQENHPHLGQKSVFLFFLFFFNFIFFHHSFKFKYHRVKTRYLEIKIELKELNMTLYSNMSDQWFWKMIEPTFNCEITFSSSPVLIYS